MRRSDKRERETGCLSPVVILWNVGKVASEGIIKRGGGISYHPFPGERSGRIAILHLRKGIRRGSFHVLSGESHSGTEKESHFSHPRQQSQSVGRKGRGERGIRRRQRPETKTTIERCHSGEEERGGNGLGFRESAQLTTGK